MTAFSEDITKTWILGKAKLVNSRPEPSRFSLLVCLIVIISGVSGFLSGIVVSYFTLGENYSSIYEGLLLELEEKQNVIEMERLRLSELQRSLTWPKNETIKPIPAYQKVPTEENYQQAVYGALSNAIESFQRRDQKGGCASLSVVKHGFHFGEWGTKALQLYRKKCLAQEPSRKN